MGRQLHMGEPIEVFAIDAMRPTQVSMSAGEFENIGE
jgi:hypothetical protein